MKSSIASRTVKLTSLLFIAVVTTMVTRLAFSLAEGGNRFQQFDKNSIATIHGLRRCRTGIARGGGK